MKRLLFALLGIAISGLTISEASLLNDAGQAKRSHSVQGTTASRAKLREIRGKAKEPLIRPGGRPPKTLSKQQLNLPSAQKSVGDQTRNASHLRQSLRDFEPDYKHTPSFQEAVAVYKERALTKIASSVSSQAPFENDTLELAYDEYSNASLDADRSSTTGGTVESDAPSEETSYKAFDFSSQAKQRISVQATDERGEPLAHVRFTLEDIQGNTILESNTGESGLYQDEMSLFSGSKLFVRFYATGISEERIELNIGD